MAQRLLLIISGAGIELSWQYAWVLLILSGTFNYIYPATVVAGIFTVSAALTQVVQGYVLRRIYALLIQVFFFLCCLLFVLHSISTSDISFWNIEWLLSFWQTPQSIREKFFISFIFASTFCFWISGNRYCLRSRVYTTYGVRFDLGVGAFFFLLFIRIIFLFFCHTSVSVSMSSIFEPKKSWPNFHSDWISAEGLISSTLLTPNLGILSFLKGAESCLLMVLDGLY